MDDKVLTSVAADLRGLRGTIDLYVEDKRMVGKINEKLSANAQRLDDEVLSGKTKEAEGKAATESKTKRKKSVAPVAAAPVKKVATKKKW